MPVQTHFGIFTRDRHGDWNGPTQTRAERFEESLLEGAYADAEELAQECEALAKKIADYLGEQQDEIRKAAGYLTDAASDIRHDIRQGVAADVVAAALDYEERE